MARTYTPSLSPLARALRGFGAPGVKPNGPVKLRKEYDSGTSFLWLPNGTASGAEITTGTPGVNSGNTLEGSSVGQVVDTGASTYSYVPINSSYDLDNQFTIIAYVKHANTTNTNDVIFGLSSSTDNDPLCAITQEGDELDVYWRNNVGTGGKVGTSTDCNLTTNWHCVAVSFESDGDGLRFFVDGVKKTTRSLTGGTGTATFDRLGVGALVRASIALQYTGKIALGFVTNESYSDALIKYLTADPIRLLEPANSSPFLIGAAAGGGADHDLLADNVESASNVDTPTLGQAHALIATEVESATQVSTPALTQIHALTATSVESASNVSAPSVVDIPSGADHNLFATDVESASETSTPAIGQLHALTQTGTESASEVSTPALTQIHALTVTAVESASSVSTPTVVDSGSITNAMIWAKLIEIHKIMGLDATAPMTVTPTSRVAGDISQTISGDGVTSTTVTRDT